MSNEPIKIHSIFQSIDGECNFRGQGCLTTFLRVSNCNLRCSYCDVPDAQTGGTYTSIDAAVEHLTRLDCPNLTITGGEPLLQAEAVYTLIQRLSVRLPRLSVSIETNGTQEPFKIIPPLKFVSFVVDFKLPSAKVDLPLLDFSKVYGKLRKIDWIKLVIKDEEDYIQARTAVERLFYKNSARMAFSPMFGENIVLTPSLLAQKMIKDRLWNVTLSVQIHKFIGVS
jgi:7-carboxy-7-deazaguanine synthase